jgi:segregation and condensation protein A
MAADEGRDDRPAAEAPSPQAIAEWETPATEARDGEAFNVDVAGFEGPLDLLLALARTHKVDIAKISVVALVDQYLAFIADARRLRIELAADYLVMAAWLAFLKSRLLLPRQEVEAETATAEEMARRLAFRLQRLAAMRERAEALMLRPRLGITVFGRGAPEGVKINKEPRYTAEIYDLLKAYADQRRRTIKVHHVVKARRVWSIKDARQRLERLVGTTLEWTQLDLFLVKFLPTGEDRRTVLASSFGASLELAREGKVDIRQEQPFAPIFMRRRDASGEPQKIG